MSHQTILPEGWVRPKGYSNAILAEGRTLFIAGLVGWDETETFASDDFTEQFTRTLKNIRAVLETAGAAPEHICRMTWYVTSKQQYLASLKGVGRAWRDIMGRTYPAMAVVEVSGLMEDRALIEIETTAVVPVG